MKVIWQNSKSLQIGIENVGFGTNKSSRHALEKSRGYCALPQEPYQEEDRKWRKMKSSVEKRLESGESGDAVKQDGDSWKPSCRVCGRGDELQDLETCDHLLLNLFGVKVQDISAKVCRDCADLMQHTQKFKDMVCAAFRATSETSTLKDGSSVHSIIAKKRGSEDHFKTVKTLKRKTKPLATGPAAKKMFAACTICKQKYPMPHATDDFVCCRCKITNSNDRTVTCVKCRSKVPSALMKEHLEIHATANLKGRCRLRSLTKNPSNVETTERVSSKNNQLQTQSMKKLQNSKFTERDHCHICGKYVFSPVYLQKHLKTHADIKTFECHFCGRIFKGVTALQKHTSVRHMNKLMSDE